MTLGPSSSSGVAKPQQSRAPNPSQPLSVTRHHHHTQPPGHSKNAAATAISHSLSGSKPSKPHPHPGQIEGKPGIVHNTKPSQPSVPHQHPSQQRHNKHQHDTAQRNDIKDRSHKHHHQAPPTGSLSSSSHHGGAHHKHAQPHVGGLVKERQNVHHRNEVAIGGGGGDTGSTNSVVPQTQHTNSRNALPGASSNANSGHSSIGISSRPHQVNHHPHQSHLNQQPRLHYPPTQQQQRGALKRSYTQSSGVSSTDAALMENLIRKKSKMDFSQPPLPSINRGNSPPPPPPQSPPTQPLHSSYTLAAASDHSRLPPQY